MNLAITLLFTFNLSISSSPAINNAVMSLILPGSSQIMNGSKIKGYSFIATEIFGILGNFYYRREARQFRERYRTYAYTVAGADPSVEDENYWNAIERRRSREEYIEYLWRLARSYYPTDPERQQEFVNSRMVQGNWSFPTLEEWFGYRKLRRQERSSLSDAGVMIGVIIANHIFSALDAFVSTKLAGRKVSFKTMINPERSSIFVSFKF